MCFLLPCFAVGRRQSIAISVKDAQNKIEPEALTNSTPSLPSEGAGSVLLEKSTTEAKKATLDIENELVKQDVAEVKASQLASWAWRRRRKTAQDKTDKKEPVRDPWLDKEPVQEKPKAPDCTPISSKPASTSTKCGPGHGRCSDPVQGWCSEWGWCGNGADNKKKNRYTEWNHGGCKEALKYVFGSNSKCPSGTSRVEAVSECKALVGTKIDGKYMKKWEGEECEQTSTPGEGCFYYDVTDELHSTAPGCKATSRYGYIRHFAVCKEAPK